MPQKHNDIQSVLRSYGGPSQEHTPHYDQLKSKLLRNDYFAEADAAQLPQGAVRFSWAGLLTRLSVASVPAVALVLILAIVVANYSPITAQKVLAKAAENLEASAGLGRVHYTKMRSTLYFEGVTDAYNDTTVETWIDSETYSSRTAVYTRDGQLLDDIATVGNDFYRSTESLLAKAEQTPLTEGYRYEPGGPLEQMIALDASGQGIGGGGGAGGGGPLAGDIGANVAAACAEGSGPCNDVIAYVCPDPNTPCDESEMVLIDPMVEYNPGYVGAIVGETDEDIVGGLYGISTEPDPKARAETLRRLSESPRVTYAGESEWKGHKVHAISVKYWTLEQHDTFYFDTSDYHLVGMETTFRGGMGPSGEQHIVMEILEDRYSDDASLLNTDGLEKLDPMQLYGPLPEDASSFEVLYTPTEPGTEPQPEPQL